MQCPNCRASVPNDARYCGNCGTSIAVTCSSCGTDVQPGAAYCGNCGAQLNAGSGSGSGSASTDAGTLQLRDHEFARRLDQDDLGGSGLLDWLRQKKTVTIEGGNRALVLENGKLQRVIDPGKHTLDSLGQKLAERRRGQNLAVVLVTEGTTTVSVEVEDLRTATDYLVSVGVELVIAVDDPEQLFVELVNTRDAVTGATLNALIGDAIRDELQATIAEYERDDLYGNRELKRQLRSDIEEELHRTLARSGIDLIEVLSFEYADDLDEVRERQKQVRIESERQDAADRMLENEKRERERETEGTVHEQRQRVRRESAKKTADHELDTQDIEQQHEKADKRRRHGHRAERETVEHEEEKETIRTEREVERRDTEHEQDISEIEDLVDVKKKKDMTDLDVEEREKDIEMREEEHEVEMERERLQARDEVDLETLASLDSVDEAIAELVEIEKASDLTPEQLEALGAQDSDELAKARQEAHSAEKERQRVEDQKEFREELKDVAEDSMDRVQETSESAMDSMGDAAEAAAEDTSDNVIVSDAGGSSDSGDTTIVQGGPGQGGGTQDGGTQDGGARDESGQSDGMQDSSDDEGGDGDDGTTVCPNCGTEVLAEQRFCTDCGTDL